MVRRREREDYAPEEKEPWEKREEQLERQRRRKRRIPKEEEPWEKREEQLERKRRKKRERIIEEEPEEVYEEDYEKRASVKRVREPTLFEPEKPQPPIVYSPFTGEAGIEDEGLRQYQIQRERYGPTIGAEYPQRGVLDQWLLAEERFFRETSRAGRVSAREELELAEEAKLSGRDIEAGFRFSTYTLKRASVGAFEGFTFPARPLAWGETAKTLYQLLTKKEARKEAILTAKKDPMGFLAEGVGGMAGGGAAGRTIDRLLKATGVSKPTTYRLGKTTITKPKVSETPATLMPKGKYPSGAFDVKLWKMGGTPALSLKEKPGLLTVYKPLPIYKPSLIEPGLGLLSGLRPFIGEKEKAPSKLEPLQVPSNYLDVISRIGQISEPKPSIKGIVEEKVILKPVGYKEKERAWVYPKFLGKVTEIQKTGSILGQRQVQEPLQEQKQALRLREIQIPVLARSTRQVQKTRLPPKKRKKKRRKAPFDIFGYEQRRYGVQTAKELKRLIG